MAIGVEDNNGLVLDRNRQLHLSPSLAQISYRSAFSTQFNLSNSSSSTSLVVSGKSFKLLSRCLHLLL
ncbi:hypothetical protein PanWU01x14_108320 [Parasponia andersonii]|uniref:Uncharacterized protein n=1 Tax=Parasponia andersonii TaxID=3476 RepID=A0A2P5CZV8_PARAD|nr:hypothetical protein PanWU01x14_108320 [Parasponia andersonii]